MVDYPLLAFETQQHWHDWLDEHHTDTPGVWIKIAKKASGIPSVNYSLALDEALCYGWIDGQVMPIDEIFYKQKFTPRRPRSMWSKRNIGIVEKLIADGRMKPAGQAQIDAAKQDGRWDQAYDTPTDMQIPEDLAAALEKSPAAKAFYATLNKTNRYACMWQVHTAKRPETRLARIAKIVAMLEAGETIHPQKKKA